MKLTYKLKDVVLLAVMKSSVFQALTLFVQYDKWCVWHVKKISPSEGSWVSLFGGSNLW